jgi:hypothetical protein
VALEPGILIASFIESDETISDSLHASVVTSLNETLGDADAIAQASWEHPDRQGQVRGLVAHRGAEWLLVTVAPDHRHGTYVVVNETITSLGDLQDVRFVTHRRFRTSPGSAPVEIKFHSLHLLHQEFPGGKVFIDLDERPHSEGRDEIVAAFRAVCSPA